MMRTTLLILSAAVLAACDSGKDAPPPAPTKPIVVRSEAQKQLFALTPELQAIGLKRAITATGAICKRVTATHYVGRYKNMDYWAANCDNNRDWALFVGADDSVQARLCADTAKVGLPACETVSPYPEGLGSVAQATPVKAGG